MGAEIQLCITEISYILKY